jgi:hypothetical protein
VVLSASWNAVAWARDRLKDVNPFAGATQAFRDNSQPVARAQPSEKQIEAQSESLLGDVAKTADAKEESKKLKRPKPKPTSVSSVL